VFCISVEHTKVSCILHFKHAIQQTKHKTPPRALLKHKIQIVFEIQYFKYNLHSAPHQWSTQKYFASCIHQTTYLKYKIQNISMRSTEIQNTNSILSAIFHIPVFEIHAQPWLHSAHRYIHTVMAGNNFSVGCPANPFQF